MHIYLPKLNNKMLGVAFALIAIIGIPLALYQMQQQQIIQQQASGVNVTWATTQSAVSKCPTTETTGIEVIVTFKNTEDDRDSKAMNVIATDQQTGKEINLGSIRGGATKTGTIQTGEATISAGTILFTLTWTDGHSGSDTRTAKYTAPTNCELPTPTLPIETPTSSPSATPCPTVGTVQNIRIDCPNCR
jgi:hypothetical protein